MKQDRKGPRRDERLEAIPIECFKALGVRRPYLYYATGFVERHEIS